MSNEINGLRVTKVDVYPSKSSGKLTHFVNIELNNCIQLKGFKVFNGSKGQFLSAPSTQNQKDKKYYDNIFFTDFNSETKNSPTRDLLQEKVLEVVNQASAPEQGFDQTETPRSGGGFGDNVPF